MVFIAMAQSIYSYGIRTWGGTYNTHLNLLETTINSLVKISFRKHYLTSSNFLYKECNILNLRQLYARYILSFMYFLDTNKFKFKHDYYTRTKQTNIYQIPKFNTEFWKKNP